jgi:hypothetical protein
MRAKQVLERSHHLLHALVFLFAACKAPPPPASPDLASAKLTCNAATDCSKICPSEKLEACVSACTARVSSEARPYWDALQECSKNNCKEPCTSPTAFTCKLCVTGHCASAVSGCLSH